MIKRYINKQQLELKVRIWIWSRSTAFRRIKKIMKEAKIEGEKITSPKALRHGFAVQCILEDIPINIVKVWLGHSSLRTTERYLMVLASEAKLFARKLWTKYT